MVNTITKSHLEEERVISSYPFWLQSFTERNKDKNLREAGTETNQRVAHWFNSPCLLSTTIQDTCPGVLMTSHINFQWRKCFTDLSIDNLCIFFLTESPLSHNISLCWQKIDQNSMLPRNRLVYSKLQINQPASLGFFFFFPRMVQFTFSDDYNCSNNSRNISYMWSEKEVINM